MRRGKRYRALEVVRVFLNSQPSKSLLQRQTPGGYLAIFPIESYDTK
jgi:hypothetical protein